MTDIGPDGTAFPNLTCTMKPYLTTATVDDTSGDGLFRVKSEVLVPDSRSRIPDETYQAVDRAFSLANSNSENIVIDSIHAHVATNRSVSIPDAFQYITKG